ncbi:hypothetical protein [Altererythrobacter sp.]|uniref:hypothetical protein n=1 Tax=Altererythrobacter sp. TaxID=1872480 RepID=UPI003D036AA4
MSDEYEKENFEKCVAKNGWRICREDPAPKTAGLLCETHLGYLQKGKSIKFRADLKVYQRKQLELIKRLIDPLAGRKHKEEAKGSDAKVERFLLSFPAIFALTGTSTVLLFEQVWTTGLGITLPFGAGLSSGVSPLLLQVMIYLLGMAVAFIALMLLLIVIVLAISPILSVLYFIIRTSPIYVWLLLSLTKMLSAHNYSRLRPANDRIGEDRYLKNELARQEAWSKLDGWNLDQVQFFRKMWHSMMKLWDLTWRTLFGAEQVTIRAATARATAIFAAFLALSYATSRQAVALRTQLEFTAEGAEMAPRSCVTLQASLWTALLGADIGMNDEQVEPADGLIRTDEVQSALDVLLTFLRAEIPCGRITLASYDVLAVSPLLDASLRPDAPLSGEAFYLGRYGDWVVFAPLNDPTKRVLLTSRQVLGFTKIEEENLPKADPVPPVVKVVEGRGDQALRESLFMNTALIMSTAFVLRQEQSRLQDELNRLRAWVEEGGGVDLQSLIDGIAKDRPWRDDLEAAQKWQMDLTRFVTSSSERLRLTQSHDLKEVIEAFTQQLASVATRSIEVTIAPQQSILTFPEELAQDISDIRTAAEDLYRHVVKESVGLGTASARPQVAGLLSELMIDSPGNTCSESDHPSYQVIFGEGETRPGNAEIERIATDLLEMRPQGDVNGQILVEIKGYASATGSSFRNSVIAEARADNVKRALVEQMFKVTPPQNGDEDGPELLTNEGMIVVAYGAGETLDGVGAHHPRRADVSICWLIAPIAPGQPFESETLEAEMHSDRLDLTGPLNDHK